MLTVEVLRANQVLAGLSAEQLAVIADLSKNDEEVTIGKRIGELHGSYDNDILSVTSVAKNDGEKSYDYLKRVLTDYKTKVEERDGLKTKLKEQEQKITDLQKQVDGGNAEISKQLKDEMSLTAQLRQKLSEKDTEISNVKKDYEAKLNGYMVDSAFDAVFSGLTFKPDISEAVQDAMKKAAKAEVMAKGTLSYDEERKSFVLRDSKGEIVRNQGNSMNPYTIAELVGETSIKDVLQQQKSGGGTKPPTGGGQNITLLDLSAAKTQSDADELISSHLVAKGFSTESPEYWEQFTQIRNDNNVSALPMS